MFFKKRQEAAKAARIEAQQKTLGGFQAGIDTALKIDDPAAKLIELERLSATMTAAAKQASVNGWAEGAGLGVSMTIGVAVITGTAAIVTACAFPPGVMLIGLLPAVIGGIAGGNVVDEKLAASNAAKVRPLVEGIAAKQQAISAAVEAVVKDNLECLTASPRFAELQERPALRDIFMSAMQKRVSGQDAPAPEAPKRPEGGLNL